MKDGTYRSLCCLCHSACGLVVQIKNGKAVSLKGDPENPAACGYLCPKVMAAEEMSRSPDRLRRPLQRTASGFREISWENAYDLAAEKLSGILSQYGPAGLMRCSGAPVSYEARDGFNYFMRLCGSPNATGSSAYCMVPRVTAYMMVMGGKPEPDFDRADMILMWGSNPAATNRLGGYCSYNGINRVLERARKRGAKVVFIDPVRCESIRPGDEWLSIQPGTDAVLALAMLRQIFSEKLYDADFIKNYTVGFDELYRHVQPYTPEFAEQKTSVPAAVIVSLAERFARSRTATICDGNGLDMYCNTVYTVQAVADLLAVTGRIDTTGGVMFLPFVPQASMNNLNPADMALKHKYPLFRDIPFPAVKEALLADEPDRPHAMIVHHANPALINANTPRTAQALRKLDFLMVDDIFMTSTAQLADLVLPSASFFERYGYKAYTSFDRCFVALSRPLFDAPGEAKSVFEMEYEIGRRMGFGDRYPFHDDISWINYALAPSGITFEQLEREQILFFDKPVVEFKYREKGFNTPSKKVELFSERMQKNGYSPLPLPADATGGLLEKNSGQYPLLLINRRPGAFVHTKLHNLHAATDRCPAPELRLGPADAAQYGICTGDTVELATATGKGSFTAHICDDMQPGTVSLDFGWGNPTDSGTDLNAMTPDTAFDPISGGTPNRLFRGKIVSVTHP